VIGLAEGSYGTPLSRKLGITDGDRVGTLGAPEHFADLVEPLPNGASLIPSPRAPCPVQIVFATTTHDFATRFASAVNLLPADGGLWVAWPKATSGVDTDLDFDLVQRHGLDAGLVDNKVAAIDDVWTGLRFVVRLEDRAKWPVTSTHGG
jgi:hypothetical protein